ncbi:MAG: DUF2207 domain-containing protein [Candidatus Binatia bacterium]
MRSAPPQLKHGFTTATVLVLALALHFSASARELRIDRFDADIIVSRSGVIDVTEAIQLNFVGSWNGLFREIPIEYVTPQGMNYSLFLDVKSVAEINGDPLKYESSRERHYRKLKIYVPNARDITRTVVIRYTVSNALRFFEDHDELYWNVTGDEWDAPIRSASASILLPEGTSNLRTNAFTGVYGARGGSAEAKIDGNRVHFQTTQPLRYHEGLTIAVAFDKGSVQEPSYAYKFILFLRSNWPFGAPIVAFLFMLWLWSTRGRDPRLRPIAAQYQPLAELSPGEVGTLVDDAADMRDITATLVDLAVRGYLVIREDTTERMLGLWTDQNYTFILKKSRAEWVPLKAHEQLLLSGIFSAGTAGEAILMSSLQNRFYKNLPAIQDRLLDSLVQHNYYRRRPDATRFSYIVLGLVLGFLLFWGGQYMGHILGMQSLPFVLAAIATAAVICIFGWFMPARTMQGTRALESVLGFEDFLDHVEADRFSRVIKTPEMFEKFLPYAMALNVEKNWSQAFEDIYREPPEWYAGTSEPRFHSTGFVRSLSDMSTRAGTVMRSAPRSSGGSGFSGGGSSGGSSGGGFGGGGGRGF